MPVSKIPVGEKKHVEEIVKSSLLKHASMVIHMKNEYLRERRVLQTEHVRNVIVPLLVLSVRCGQPPRSKTFLWSVECIHHITCDFGEPALVIDE